MFNFKKLTAVALSVVMTLSMAACGSDNKKGKTSVDTSKIDNIYDAVELANDYNCGKYEASVDVVIKQGNQDLGISFSTDGERNVDDCTASMKFKMTSGSDSFDMKFYDLYTIVDNKLYVNVDSVLESISGVSTKAGSYGIVLPETKNKDELVKDSTKLAVDMLKSCLEDVDVEGSNGSFTVSFKNGKDYYNFINGLLKFVQRNNGAIEDLLNKSANSVDYSKWIDAVVKDSSDDIVDVANKFGAQISKSDIKDVADEIKNETPDTTEKIELFEQGDLDEIVEEFKEVSPDDFDAILSEVDKLDCKFNVEAKEKSYKVTASTTVAAEGVEMELNVTYKIDLESVNIKKPANATTLSKMVDYVMDNQEVFMNVMNGAQDFVAKAEKFGKKLQELGGDVDDFTDEFDW